VVPADRRARGWLRRDRSVQSLDGDPLAGIDRCPAVVGECVAGCAVPSHCVVGARRRRRRAGDHGLVEPCHPHDGGVGPTVREPGDPCLHPQASCLTGAAGPSRLTTVATVPKPVNASSATTRRPGARQDLHPRPAAAAARLRSQRRLPSRVSHRPEGAGPHRPPRRGPAARRGREAGTGESTPITTERSRGSLATVEVGTPQTSPALLRRRRRLLRRRRRPRRPHPCPQLESRRGQWPLQR